MQPTKCYLELIQTNPKQNSPRHLAYKEYLVRRRNGMPQPKPRPKKLNAGKRRFQHSKLSSQEILELPATHSKSTEPPQRQS